MANKTGLRAHLRSFVRTNRVGLSLALISFWLGLLWLSTIRPFNAPDEPAHLQAIMQVRIANILPEVHYDFSTDPKGRIVNTPVDQATYDYIVSSGTNSPDRLIPNESVQPPLYYGIVGLVLHLFPANPQLMLYLARLFSTLFGAGTVFFCWAAVRQIAPTAPMWAAAVAGMVALLPQFCFNNGAVSNDSLANMLAAASFYVWFKGLRNPAYDHSMLLAGAIVGLALLAKLSAVGLIPGIALVVIFRAFQPDRLNTVSLSNREWLRRGLRMALGAAVAFIVVFGWFPLRNLVVYGELTGVGQALTYAHANYPMFDLNAPQVHDLLVVSTWESFWGVFSWMNSRMPDDFYYQALFFSNLALIFAPLAFMIYVARRIFAKKRVAVLAYAWQSGAIMLVVAVALVIGYIQFNSAFAFQPQGRYLFTLLLPASVLFTGGIHWLMPYRILKILALSVPILWLAWMNLLGLLIVR